METTGIDRLNSLLRGELAATETYLEALTKVADEPAAAELRRVEVEHHEAANILRQHIHKFGGKPDQKSGLWGSFARVWEGSAKLFGNKAALGALKQGEERGISNYESALKDARMASECKELIRNTLLPQTREHIQVLDRVMAQQ